MSLIPLIWRLFLHGLTHAAWLQVILRKLHQVVTPSTNVDGNIGPDANHLLAIKEVLTYRCCLVVYFCVLLQVFVLYSDAKCSYFELSTWQRIVYFLQESNGSDNGSVTYGFAFVDCARLRLWIGSIDDDVSCSALGALLMQVCTKYPSFTGSCFCT